MNADNTKTVLSAFICVHRRPELFWFYFRTFRNSIVFIGGHQIVCAN